MLTLREVALCICVAQALDMCSICTHTGTASARLGSGRKMGSIFRARKRPQSCEPQLLGFGLLGPFFVRKMDAKLAPPFDFGVALVFMRKGFCGAACRISFVMFATPSLVSMCPAGW